MTFASPTPYIAEAIPTTTLTEIFNAKFAEIAMLIEGAGAENGSSNMAEYLRTHENGQSPEVQSFLVFIDRTIECSGIPIDLERLAPTISILQAIYTSIETKPEEENLLRLQFIHAGHSCKAILYPPGTFSGINENTLHVLTIENDNSMLVTNVNEFVDGNLRVVNSNVNSNIPIPNKIVSVADLSEASLAFNGQDIIKLAFSTQ